jgi:predicted RNA methylase
MAAGEHTCERKTSFRVATRRWLRTSHFLMHFLRREGLRALLRTLFHRLTQTVSRDPFDEKYGVDTSGEISLLQLEIASRNDVVGVRYQGSPPHSCERLVASLPICHNDFVFIDVGAGKGRVLLIASHFSFKRVIGVEFAKELVDTARTNIARFGCKAEVVHADAAEYDFPCDDLVIYLYNPFGPEVLRPVLRSLRTISATHEVYLVYVNPKHSLCIQEFASEEYMIDGAKVYRMNANAVGKRS